jgi:NhaA family Na+:H+ antiporter
LNTLRDFVATGPLVLFFLLAGIELKAELIDGTFRKRYSFLVPFSAALGGMIVPALLYFTLAKGLSTNASAWGVPMATDLPLAILALSIFTTQVAARIRGFLLALAIADDIGSIVVVAIVYHKHIDFLALAFSALFLGIFWLLAPKLPRAATFIALATWFLFRNSGIHPTVIGVALGLCLNHEESEWLIKKLTPIVNYLIVPLFIVTALWVPWNFHINARGSSIILAIIMARLLGKPLGVWVFGLLAMRVSKNYLITPKDLLSVGAIATLGLSVSILFANLANLDTDLNATLIGILLTIPLSALMIKMRSKIITR